MAVPETRAQFTNRFRNAATRVMLMMAVTLLGACGQGDRPNSGMMPAVPVLTATAARRTVPNQLEEIGTVEAFATVNIKSRIGGHLLAIHFKEGDFVTKDQLLFSLDARISQSSLRLAEANLARDEAQARQAATEKTRFATLLREGVGSREQYDQARASAGTWIATVAADQAGIDTARVNLQYTEIRSPIDGRTGNLQSHIGDLIKPDADAPLVTITQIQPIYVDFSTPERELTAVREAFEQHPLEVAASIPNSPGAAEHGTLSFIDNAVDKTTGSILLKGLFQNAQRRLWPGAFVNVTLTVNELRDAIVVPSEAIQTSQQGTFVFVVGVDHKVAMRPVAIGARVDRQTVVERGLAAGETVVTDGQLRLAPGAVVSLKQSL
jgi:multidrug efflux system membrane fusion protein